MPYICRVIKKQRVIIKKKKDMNSHKKTFEFNLEVISIERLSSSSYRLTGHGTTVLSNSSWVWDECDNEDDEDKCYEARARASYELMDQWV